MYTDEKVFLVFILVFIPQYIDCSFWNEIPHQCIYDRTGLFKCWNTTFIHPIPLFNDLTYTFHNHYVEISNSYFDLTLRDILVNVGTNIQNLTLINNKFSSKAIESNKIFEGGLFFRLLKTIQIHDTQCLQWFQLNGSYFPQLIDIDLSYNRLTDKNKLVFSYEYYPQLKYLNLSNNHLQTLNNIQGSCLNHIEILILSNNPLEFINNKIEQYRSLIHIDLSSTLIKELFNIKLLPNLQIFTCQKCQQISTWQYEKFLSNCSISNTKKLDLDFTHSNIYSIKLFNPYMKCIKTLILNEQNLVESISTFDLLNSIHLESIQGKLNYDIDHLHLNVYNRLLSIDFSENIYLNQVMLRLMSNDIHLQNLILSYTSLNDFTIDFYNTTLNYLHIDTINMSHCRLETLDFIKYLTFYTLDVSYNRLKIIDIDLIHFRHGMYDLSLMNLLNLSSNDMEYIKINWDDQSPHSIDLSQNKLESIELHGQTTYTLYLNNNYNLSLNQTSFNIDLPSLKYLDLTSININSLEYLIYLHNLSNIHTLILDNNILLKEHRTLNWNLFYPWHKYLTHLSLRNLSIEMIDRGAHLHDYYHLLTIDFYGNIISTCDCTLEPFINWLKTPPPPLIDFNEPINKVLRIDCPTSLFDFECNGNSIEKYHSNVGPSKFFSLIHMSYFNIVILCFIVIGMVLTILSLIDRRMRKYRSRFYQQVYTDANFIRLNERCVTNKTNDE